MMEWVKERPKIDGFYCWRRTVRDKPYRWDVYNVFDNEYWQGGTSVWRPRGGWWCLILKHEDV